MPGNSTGHSRLLAAGLALLLAGCTTHVSGQAAYSGRPLPRPAVIYVEDFAVAPQAVTLDQGVRARLARLLSTSSGGEEQRVVAASVQSALADSLVAEIGAMGLPVRRVSAPPPQGAAGVLLAGEITRINQGNATRRTVIGLGAGKSNVAAQARLMALAPTSRLLADYQASADSGRAPGVGIMGPASPNTAAALAAGGAAHGLSEAFQADVQDEAKRLARGLSVQLGRYFAAEGWIPPSAVPAPLP